MESKKDDIDMYQLPCELISDVLAGKYAVGSTITLFAQAKSIRSKFLDVKDGSGTAGQFIQVVADPKTCKIWHAEIPESQVQLEPGIEKLTKDDIVGADNSRWTERLFDKSEAYGKHVLKHIKTGMFVNVTGKLSQYFKRDDKDKKSPIWEIHASDVQVFGSVTNKFLPLSKDLSLSSFTGTQTYLRAHYEPYRAIWNIRDHLEFAIHEFMRKYKYRKLDPNIVTISDCEGAGEMFVLANKVTVPPPSIQKQVLWWIVTLLTFFIGLGTIFVLTVESVSKQSRLLDFSTLACIVAWVYFLKIVMPDFRFKTTIKWDTTSFFGQQAGLTVSSQLPLENEIPAVTGVYTMNKSFRAEESQTTRHQAEFTHLEWESRYIRTLAELTCFTGSLVRHVIRSVLANMRADLDFLQAHYEIMGESEGHANFIKKLEFLANCKYETITYSECIKIIARDERKVRKLYKLDGDKIPQWGDDLKAACERYICEVIFEGRPVFITKMPAILKSFYMSQDSDGTVQACDFIIPGIGELVGSSIREYRLDKLLTVMKQRKMDISLVSAYVALRRDATCPHGGAGLGFDRLLQLCTGTTNIRHGIPCPIAYKECDDYGPRKEEW